MYLCFDMELSNIKSAENTYVYILVLFFVLSYEYPEETVKLLHAAGNRL